MGYSSGMMDTRVAVLARMSANDGAFGRKLGEYEEIMTVWASVTWTKGMKAMREGALDAYDTVMVRTRWYSGLKRDCRLKWDGRTYQIASFMEDKKGNQMQMVCVEVKD